MREPPTASQFPPYVADQQYEVIRWRSDETRYAVAKRGGHLICIHHVGRSTV